VQGVSGHDSAIFWRCCDMSCISGFVDNVIFSYNGPCGDMMLPQHRHLLQRHAARPCPSGKPTID